ncbi:helix-turn-helix domain-containing protein [Flagellimonas halotolerans]|uniref:helix-turn-helix domain-containing protein n=1 Tax=Flagellimonas halotolerans TaxID=3112164 RepID=UPI003D17AA89
MSVTKFTALFKDLMGSTFSEFALQYRVKGASFQLKTSNLTLETVAVNWGYADASHLHEYV